MTARFPRGLLAAALPVLSVTGALVLVLCIGSCQKEEPEEVFEAVTLRATVTAPQALLNVAELTATIRTSDNLVVETVDSPDWTFVYTVTGRSEIATAMPMYFDVSLKGKDVEKGRPIDAGVTYKLDFESCFESGKTLPFASFEKKNFAHVIWISSTGRYGSLLPLEYSWKGEIKKAADLPAKYAVNGLSL